MEPAVSVIALTVLTGLKLRYKKHTVVVPWTSIQDRNAFLKVIHMQQCNSSYININVHVETRPAILLGHELVCPIKDTHHGNLDLLEELVRWAAHWQVFLGTLHPWCSYRSSNSDPFLGEILSGIKYVCSVNVNLQVFLVAQSKPVFMPCCTNTLVQPLTQRVGHWKQNYVVQ